MEQDKVIRIGDFITVNELASVLNISVAGLVGELFKNGIVATINQQIDFDTVSIILEELGIEAKLEKAERKVKEVEKHILSDKASERPPIVAIMGHVDHGKTSLLDFILKTEVAQKEAGGITQYISAYQTNYKNRVITLLDTPGHEAFAAVRQHGAILTDIVVIVVAADDGVKPQTVEAIKFAESANAKIIIAINKIDKPTADLNRVMSQLAADHRLNPEEWGGDTIMVPVSAKTGEGVDKLLDSILLVADMEELKADTQNTLAEGLVIESQIQKGKGPIVGLLVEQGELKVGDCLVAGANYAKVRTIVDFMGRPIKKAGPSTPVTVTGFKTLPNFGEIFQEFKNEREARASSTQNRINFANSSATSNVTSSDLLNMMKQFDDAKNYNLVIKADVQGSLTSIIDSLKMIDTEGEVKLNIVSSGIGDITENDLKMAAGGNTTIYGFNVNVSSSVKRLANLAKVPVKMYKVIYELIDDSRQAIESMLDPEIKIIEVGKLKVKGVFKTNKDKIIAGGLVTQGKLTPGLVARLKRDKQVVGELEVESVERNKLEVKEVLEGEMCGLSLKAKGKIKLEIDDQLEFYRREIIPKKLK